MKLRLPLGLLSLVTAFLVTSAHAVSVSDWTELKAAWDNGDRNFTLTGGIEFPPFDATQLGPDINTDTGIKPSSALAINAGESVTMEGGNFYFGYPEHDHNHANEIARSFYSAGTLVARNLTFVNNYSTASLYGKAGAFYADDGAVTRFELVNFSKNHLKVEGTDARTASGGAFVNGKGLYNSTGATALLQGSVFEENFIVINCTGDHALETNGFGGAIINNYESVLTITGSTFRGNYVSAVTAGRNLHAYGGAIDSDGARLDISDSSFTGNYITAYFGDGSTAPPTNEEAGGGALRITGGETNLVRVRFEGNYLQGNVRQLGGAIMNGSWATGLYLTDCIFEGNYTGHSSVSKGGAIYHNTTRENVQIASVDYDSFFRGNRVNVSVVDADGKPADGVANAIFFENERIATIDFRALKAYDPENVEAGSSLIFYDPVVFAPSADAVDVSFNFNRAEGATQYKGRVVFTGEDFSDTDDVANWNSTANGQTKFIQHDGALVIKEKARLGAGTTDSIGAASYEMKKGVLELISRGRLFAKTASFNTGNSWKESIIRADNTARLDTQTLDLSRGISFDFNPFMTQRNSGLQVYAGDVTFGGNMGIIDNGLDYYMNNRWGTEQRFLALDFVKEYTLTGTFDVLSHQYNSNIVDSEYGWQGTWSYEIVDGPDGTKDLYAVWTPTGGGPGPDPDPTPDPDPDPTPDPDPAPNPGIKDIHPELAGNIVMNSLWSTTSNMRALGNFALGQIDFNRYRLEKCANYWATGLGDFDMHRSVGKRDGYDYNGFGYAVGADTRLCPDNYLVGVAFGNLYGKNKSRNYSAEIKQASYIGMIYGGWLKDIDQSNAINVTGTASYGLTTNKLNTKYSDGLNSRGKWDNDAMRFTLRAEWLRSLGDNWTMTTFVGAEYDDATQQSFSETGDRPRHFSDGHLRNLALPVGLGISKQLDYSNGMKWINSLTASYLPDVYRSNPESEATRLTADGYRWKARGVEVSRHAGRLDYSTRLIINPTWSTFAGYGVEVRKDAVYQDVNLGVSASF